MRKEYMPQKFLLHQNNWSILLISLLLVIATNCTPQDETVKDVMDNVVSRFYDSMNENELNTLTTEKILSLLSEDELEILSTQHWMFDANVPVTVYVMQDKSQSDIPFWLSTANFEKTGMVVKNKYSDYQVWKKNFKAGRINLGINGFDKHRPHYFVSIAPQDKAEQLKLSNFFPVDQYIAVLDSGSFTYHDWDELVLTDVPEELKGSTLLTTIRGRAREAHLIKAFRKTKYPSSIQPDQIMLTWSQNPQSSQSIQWRTNLDNNLGVVKYWKADAEGVDDTSEVVAKMNVIEDRLLQNDRYIHRFTANIEGLNAETKYFYKVGNPKLNVWSDRGEFITAAEPSSPFSFVYFGDTHNSPHWGNLINKAYERFPNTAFYTIGGDLVGTGLYRNEWDLLFEYSQNVIKNRPLMPTIGNHDSQDGLGYWMYTELFDLPKNGSKNIPVEGSYSFKYNNSLFIMLDVTSSIQAQSEWLEMQLQSNEAIWKFVFIHFPPYSYEEDYETIRKEWGTLFDKYHVDIVFAGHVHYYMRSKPMYNQKPVKSPSEGTIYVISIAVPNRKSEMPEEEFVEVRIGGEYFYQTIDIDNNVLEFRAFNQEGIERDRFRIEK
jgi:hypothetical protein